MFTETAEVYLTFGAWKTYAHDECLDISIKIIYYT